MRTLRFNKREWVLIGIALALGLILGGLLFQGGSVEHADHAHEAMAGEESVWTCSMHPQIRQNEPGKCPICAMDLVPVESDLSPDERVDLNEIQMSESAMKLADVQTIIVRRGAPRKSIHLLGKVKVDERKRTELTARFGGRIERLSVNFIGQQVEKGRKLGAIYSPDLMTAQKELLEAVQYKTSNPAFYQASRNKLTLWDLTDSQILAIESEGEPQRYFEVLSPVSGTVMQRHVAVGDYVKAGSPLFKVADLTSVWVMLDAYESDLPWIKVNDPVRFSVQSIPGKSFAGKVAYIDPFINAATRIAHVRVDVDNPKLTLKPEMFVRAVLESHAAVSSDALHIPKTAILWTGKRAVVYVKVPDREMPSFIHREITLGPEAEDFYMVENGLYAGEEIAAYGVFKIDASAQLAGKVSMMNPMGGHVSAEHDHGAVVPAGEVTEHISDSKNLTHEMFRVSGNCGMCKARIENAAMGPAGVNSAQWNAESKMLHVTFDADQVRLQEIHKAIAQAGHDTNLESAPDAVYKELPECCQYREK